MNFQSMTITEYNLKSYRGINICRLILVCNWNNFGIKKYRVILNTKVWNDFNV